MTFPPPSQATLCVSLIRYERRLKGNSCNSAAQIKGKIRPFNQQTRLLSIERRDDRRGSEVTEGVTAGKNFYLFSKIKGKSKMFFLLLSL